MKKNFKNPELIISTFSCENIVTTSGVTAEQSVRDNAEFSGNIGNGEVAVRDWSVMVTF